MMPVSEYSHGSAGPSQNEARLLGRPPRCHVPFVDDGDYQPRQRASRTPTSTPPTLLVVRGHVCAPPGTRDQDRFARRDRLSSAARPHRRADRRTRYPDGEPGQSSAHPACQRRMAEITFTIGARTGASNQRICSSSSPTFQAEASPNTSGRSSKPSPTNTGAVAMASGCPIAERCARPVSVCGQHHVGGCWSSR